MIGSSVVPGLPNMCVTPSSTRSWRKALRPVVFVIPMRARCDESRGRGYYRAVETEQGQHFVAAVSFAFGMLAWLQMPAVCGFMLSSARPGAGHTRYSNLPGRVIRGRGLVSAIRPLL